MSEEDILVLESVANTLRGMAFDPRIPDDVRACLKDQYRRIDEITAEYPYPVLGEEDD